MPTMRSQPVTRGVILLVDDFEPLLAVMQEILEETNFIVLRAGSAEEALQLAETCRPPIRLLVTSLHLPGMGGLRLAQRLRTRLPGLVVLYTSSNLAEILDVPDASEVVSSVLPRPFSREILLSRVKVLLDARP